MKKRTVGFHIILNMEYVAPEGNRRSMFFDGTVGVRRGAPARAIFDTVMEHASNKAGYTIPLADAVIHTYTVTPDRITKRHR